MIKVKNNHVLIEVSKGIYYRISEGFRMIGLDVESSFISVTKITKSDIIIIENILNEEDISNDDMSVILMNMNSFSNNNFREFRAGVMKL